MSLSKVNEDLQKERDKCSFDVAELTHLIDGGQEKTLDRRNKEILLLSDNVYEGFPESHLGHKGAYEYGVKKATKLLSILIRERPADLSDYREILFLLYRSILSQDGSSIGVHYVMFIPTIIGQCSPEQRALWLPRAMECSIIGSYAQTELGHGTFIRGLETTATYDPITKEFILNTPTRTSYKWWSGGLGHTANYCIVVAQLYTQGKCHGTHPFMVQVRDEETHQPLSGIKIGDIGPKMGYLSVNNGFLGLDNVRIPRTNMLMKHAQVLEVSGQHLCPIATLYGDGTYVKSQSSKLTYGTMVFVRVVIVQDMCNQLAKAATIAIRYSAVRRQCEIREGEKEVQILDYLTQQHKLFIAIASSHAQRLTSARLWQLYNNVTEKMQDGHLDTLPELHALACCLKAVVTADTTSMVERCRWACGGHGYMHSSSLPNTYAQVSAACTYEGENTVLLLQTARYLMKAWQQFLDTGKTTPTLVYLNSFGGNNVPEWKNTIEGMITGFKIMAARKISSCSNSLKKHISMGTSPEDAWNLTSVQLVAAAEAHCRVIIISTFHEEVEVMAQKVSQPTAEVLKQLDQLYSVYWTLEKRGDLLAYTKFSSKDMEYLQNWYEDLLTKLRPNAVGLVDAFDIRDEILCSTLGSYDGQVYERLMEDALKCDLNAEPVNSSFHKYLKPFMKGKL